MRIMVSRRLLTIALVQGCIVGSASAQAALDRTHLPIAEPTPPTYTELDARNAKPPPRFEVTPP